MLLVLGKGAAVGSLVGRSVGAMLWMAVGSAVGILVGQRDGVLLGSGEGAAVGVVVGSTDGSMLGLEEGATEGVLVGQRDGALLGLREGETELPVGITGVLLLASLSSRTASWELDDEEPLSPHSPVLQKPATNMTVPATKSTRSRSKAALEVPFGRCVVVNSRLLFPVQPVLSSFLLISPWRKDWVLLAMVELSMLSPSITEWPAPFAITAARAILWNTSALYRGADTAGSKVSFSRDREQS